MNTKQIKASLLSFIDVNSREIIAKGHLSKKIGTDKLQPFCRDVSDYEFAEFNDGTKFRNGDSIMARITPLFRKWKNCYGKYTG